MNGTKHETYPKLYLHAGPGLTAALERQWFGETLPMHWWDQPAVAVTDPQPYRTLLAAAHRELARLADRTGRPVDVIAHSFGGLLAFDLLAEVGERIGALTLLAPATDPYRQLATLGARLAAGPDATPTLKTAVAQARRHRSRAHLQRLVAAILATDNPLRPYWGPHADAARERHEALAAEHFAFDADTYLSVAWDRSGQTPRPPLDRPHAGGPVRCLFGRRDPLLGPAERALWRRWLPHAGHRLVEAGHFLPFELPPAHWL